MRVMSCTAPLLVLSLLGGLAGAMPRTEGKPKLLYILLDGFRYDYVDDLSASDLPGFTELISGGVKAQWVNPIYPTLSFPSWTTLSTGQYAEVHNIVGNYFYDPEDEDYFSLFDDDATGKSKWWTSEPIWTTATSAGLRVALYLWSRCDIPFFGILPEYCEKFQKITGPEIFRTNIEKALDRFDEGFDVVHVYTEHLDNIGHTIGPETQERRVATTEIDDTLVYLQEQLTARQLEDVNIVIVSDHGMNTVSPGNVTRHNLDDFLPADAVIENIADKGAFINIKVAPESLQAVYASLSTMPGVTVYLKEDIPEEFHYKESDYIHDIILIADIDTWVLASSRSAQLPPRDDSFVYQGAHGFDAKQEKMRSIFYAKGPAFKSNTVLEPIDIVDIYQVIARVLNVETQPHNGTWSHVAGAFAPDRESGAISASPTLSLISGVILATILRTFHN